MNIIIGGTHGLGAKIAEKLRADGQKTFVVGRSYSLDEHGRGMAINLSRDGDVESLTAYIDNLGNNAMNAFFWVSGYGYNGDFANQPEAVRMAQVNFANVIPIAQAAWKKMLKSDDKSRFVVVSSTTGIKARSDETVYAATKYALVGFTKSLGLESERVKSNIQVSLFMPGGMQTPFWDGARPDSFDDFLDPSKVASKIIDSTQNQSDYFYEETIERGSL